jgi:hypothetical protein
MWEVAGLTLLTLRVLASIERVASTLTLGWIQGQHHPLSALLPPDEGMNLPLHQHLPHERRALADPTNGLFLGRPCCKLWTFFGTEYFNMKAILNTSFSNT